MSTTITMPQLGETVTEGTILRWAKQVGDTISEDEVLVEISTDKVDTEVPSPAGGKILEILVPEGETVEVGTPLVVIGAEGEEAEEPAKEVPAAEEPTAEEPTAEEPTAEEPTAEEPTAEEPTPEEAAEEEPAAEAKQAPEEEKEAEQPPTPSGDGKPNLMSPVVRKLVRENDLDISQITGSGQGGRITRRDVEAFMATAAAAPERPAAEAPAEPAEPKVEEPVAATPAPPAPAPAEGVEEVELSRLRVRIGENMIRAKQTAAHVWTSVEVDYERLERVRQAHKAEFKEEEGFSLTYLPFIARATIDALKEYPAVNSSLNLEEKKAVFHKSVNLGVAIDLNREGLIVATIPNADGLRLVGLARAIRALAEKGRAGKLSLDEIAGSTFTITNPGPFGSYLSAPIINVPNTGILSTETITKRPAVVTTPDGQDTIAIRHIGYLGLTWDHRAWDGSTAVLFLQRIKQNLETWEWEQELA